MTRHVRIRPTYIKEMFYSDGVFRLSIGRPLTMVKVISTDVAESMDRLNKPHVLRQKRRQIAYRTLLDTLGYAHLITHLLKFI